jgi:hypothetical protein
MQNEIMKRAMFAMPLSKEARNSGIMAGFEDEMPEEMPEEPESDMPQMARTPQNPEILMNTLRGDMRSVDARMQELAQLVGEEAAMETPPEVLALLQAQLAAPQGGIGALPQGQEMAPPPMGMPPEGGMPAEGMPPGMEGAGPFPQGGAEQAPPTPDGMPPMHAAFGALITPATRAMQFMGDKAAQYGPAMNQYLGNLTMRAQPTVQRLMGGNPAMPLSVQARESLVQGPAGTVVEGVGTKLAPYTTMGPLMTPTFTEGLKMGVQRAAQEYPRVAETLSRISPGLGLAAGALSATPFMKGSNEGRTPEQEASYQALIAQIPKNGPSPAAPAEQAPAAPAAPTGAQLPVPKLGMEAVSPTEFATSEDLAAQAPEKASTQEFIKAAMKEKTRAERTKEGYNELAPLFQEILGSDKEDMKTNALLLLADAGLKIASSRQPTAAMGLAEGLGGLPRGFMGLLAQSKDRDLKIKSAALSQAFTDVQEQDKYAQQLKMEVLKGDFRIMLEQAKNGGAIIEDGGAGLRVGKTKQGGFVGVSIDPKDPTVQSAVQSRWTLRDTDNPFVENRGQAPATVETDKGERVKLTSTLRALDNSLSTLDNLKGTYTNLYSPGTWFVDKVNNLIVPVSGGLVRPDVNQADAAQRVSSGMNAILKSIASANDSGRVAVQEQEWARKTAENISDPNAFFQNKELAAKGFTSLEAMLRNARQQTLTQLGYENNDYAMRTPNTGTQSDPFVIPADKDSQRVMFNFLGSTIGKLQDPAATVYVRMPNNTVQQFNPTQLRGLIGNQ